MDPLRLSAGKLSIEKYNMHTINTIAIVSINQEAFDTRASEVIQTGRLKIIWLFGEDIAFF